MRVLKIELKANKRQQIRIKCLEIEAPQAIRVKSQRRESSVWLLFDTSYKPKEFLAMHSNQSKGSTALLLSLLILLLGVTLSHGDLLDCEEKLPGLSDLTDKISEATGSSSSTEHGVRDFFKNFGCQIKKGAKKLGEKAKDLGEELKEGAQKWGEKAKDLGSDLKERFADFREKLSKDSVEEMSKDRGFLANVEIINPDILKGEQQCGHGHILDALGNCSKLRK